MKYGIYDKSQQRIKQYDIKVQHQCEVENYVSILLGLSAFG
jgi:hypothetical protein